MKHIFKMYRKFINEKKLFEDTLNFQSIDVNMLLFKVFGNLLQTFLVTLAFYISKYLKSLIRLYLVQNFAFFKLHEQFV